MVVVFERATFSEHWYRVAGMRVRLRASVQVHRQRYRGDAWYVVEDPAANRFFRMSAGAYAFVGLLDGRRTVEEAWEGCQEQMGDDAPTQVEAIRVLGELYTSNLLRGEVAGDAAALFERHRTRVKREWAGRAASFLFMRIPLLDPDRFLSTWVPIAGRLFTPLGFVVWLLIVLLGVAGVLQEWGAFTSGAGSVLSARNLGLMYVAFAGVKLLHELGHGFACKWFGRREGTGGEVHALGVMMLVLMPVPYVDATSAWALRSKWRRMIVGAAGMFVELGVAGIAAMVWAGASEGIVRAIAYNVVFIASVSTLLFNANPLLRYDGYYILSDWLEIPNLAQRSKEQVYYMVKRWVWGMRDVRPPARSSGEAWLLGVYGVASGVYRLFVAAVIIMFISRQLFFVGVLAAVAAAAMMLVWPMLRFVGYVWTSPELMRVRGRAVLTSFGAAGMAAVLLGLIPAPDRVVVEGVVEARERVGVYAGADGFIIRATEDGTPVMGDAVLVVAQNQEMAAARAEALAAVRGAEARYRVALTKDPAEAQIRAEEVAALKERVASLDERIKGLVTESPIEGVWVCPATDSLSGRFVRRGEQIGEVVTEGDVRVRAVVGQRVAAALIAESAKGVEVRARGRGWTTYEGVAGEPSPAGRRELTSGALADVAGGGVATEKGEHGGVVAREAQFEVPVDLEGEAPGLRVGQRVGVRFDLARKPLGVQFARAVRQLFQGRRSIER